MANPIVAFFFEQVRKDIRASLRHWGKELGKNKFRLAVKIFFNPATEQIEYDLVEGFDGSGGEVVWEKIQSMDFNTHILLLPEDGTDMYQKEAQLTPHLGTALQKLTTEFECEPTELYVVVYLVAEDNELPTFVAYVQNKYKRVVDVLKEFVS